MWLGYIHPRSQCAGGEACCCGYSGGISGFLKAVSQRRIGAFKRFVDQITAHGGGRSLLPRPSASPIPCAPQALPLPPRPAPRPPLCFGLGAAGLKRQFSYPPEESGGKRRQCMARKGTAVFTMDKGGTRVPGPKGSRVRVLQCTGGSCSAASYPTCQRSSF